MTTRDTTKRPPKPRLPGRGRAGADAAAAAAPASLETVAARLEEVRDLVAGVDAALRPRGRVGDVEAEEHALLNLVDAIVDRRTERVLLPLAHLAILLDRVGADAAGIDRVALLHESGVQLDLVLDALGLERIAPARGDEADPWLHEEVEVVEASEQAEGLVEWLVRPGIRVRGGKTLVPALVATSGGRGGA
jgi:hypothetical protein